MAIAIDNEMMIINYDILNNNKDKEIKTHP